MTLLDHVRGLRMDTSPLRESRDFTLLFAAGTIFAFGSMITYVAIPYQVYRLTDSNFMVSTLR